MKIGVFVRVMVYGTAQYLCVRACKIVLLEASSSTVDVILTFI